MENNTLKIELIFGEKDYVGDVTLKEAFEKGQIKITTSNIRLSGPSVNDMRDDVLEGIRDGIMYGLTKKV